MSEIVRHPRLRVVPGKHQAVGYEFIEAAHGEPDFRIVGAGGYETESFTEYAARYWAARWNCHGASSAPCRVQSRIVGITDWRDAEPNPLLEQQIARELDALGSFPSTISKGEGDRG
jgi:hypothetical protein